MSILARPSSTYGIKVFVVFIVILLSIVFILFGVEVYDLADGRLLIRNDSIFCAITLRSEEQLEKKADMIVITEYGEEVLCNAHYIHTKGSTLYFNLNCDTDRHTLLNNGDTIEVKFNKASLFSQMINVSAK